MHALVYYVVKFVFVTLGLGSGVRGPGSSDDIHLDPVSHPNTRDLIGGKYNKQLRGTAVPAAVRKQVVSHFPSEERSSDEKGKDYRRWYTVRSEAEVVLKYFLFNLLTFIFKSLIFMGDKKEKRK